MVDDWLHLEQMDKNYWWMRVGDVTLDILIDKKGKAQVKIRDEPP